MHNHDEDNGTFFCQIDTHRATKDYGNGGRCVRLVGIRPSELERLDDEEGVETFIIDIDFWHYGVRALRLKHWRQIRTAECARLDALDEDAAEMNSWYKLKVQWVAKGNGYLYSSFSQEAPRFFDIRTLERFLEPQPLTPVKATSQRKSIEAAVTLEHEGQALELMPSARQQTARPFSFESFHVGQGMCSLVHNGDVGVLLDVGAGKPVTRNAYLATKLQNDVRSTTDKLSSLALAVSHADSDHWRILAWDQQLRNKIEKIYVPVGARSLALKDRAVASKIVPTANRVIWFAANTWLVLLRSDPKLSDSNGDCLVAAFYRDGKIALASGDYVYKRFQDDGNRYIRRLRRQRFSAVVVPHHGDLASASNVVRSAANARAFFSAGTHQGYGHPRVESIDAHAAKSFTTLHDNTQKDILKVTLL